MKLMMGEMAEDTVLASQRVVPRRLLDAGFDFELPDARVGAATPSIGAAHVEWLG